MAQIYMVGQRPIPDERVFVPICSWCHKPIVPVERWIRAWRVDWNGEKYVEQVHYLHGTAAVDDDEPYVDARGNVIHWRVWGSCWGNWWKEPEHQ